MPQGGVAVPPPRARSSTMVVLVLLIGLAVAAIVYVATGGHVFLLPLILLPFVFFWPRHSGRQRRL
jgi:hypothetical protein